MRVQALSPPLLLLAICWTSCQGGACAQPLRAVMGANSSHEQRSVQAPKAVAARTAYMFVCTAECNSTDLMADYRAHAADITGIILYTFVMVNNTLVPNPNRGFPRDQCTAYMPQWKAIAPIYAAVAVKNPSTTWVSPATEQKFIENAIATAHQLGLSGYNMDHEGSAHGPPEYLSFLSKFATALHANGMTLTSDVDGCPQGCEGITCEQVLLMSWYDGGAGQRFMNKVLNTTKPTSLGPAKTMAGWAGSHWLHNCSIMDFVLKQGISSIGYWCSTMSSQNWDLLHEFLTVDPLNPPNATERACTSPPGPPAPPVRITRGGDSCMTASSVTQKAALGLSPCGSAKGALDMWEQVGSRDSGSLNLMLANASEVWCATVVSARRGHSPCEQVGSAPIALSHLRCSGHSIEFNANSGTLEVQSCPGTCAGVGNSEDAYRIEEKLLGSLWTALTLVNCTDPRAMGFSITPATL